jgi:hypothetical protein
MKKHIYVLFGILGLLMSCEDMVQEIPWNSQNIPEKIIVEGSVTTEFGTHPVTLKYSDDYFANRPSRPVTSATLTVKNNEQVIHYVESEEVPGKYEAETGFSGEVGQPYELTIQLETEIGGKKLYTAETEIIKGMRLDSITAELYNNPVYFDDEDSLVVVVFVYGMEPEDISNYYLLKILKNGNLVSDTINQYRHFGDIESGMNGTDAFGFLVHDEFKGGDILGVQLYSIPEEYDYFLDGINQISEPGNPFGFSGPPANATGNINHGEGLGFYFGAQVTYAETLVEDRTD